MNPFAFTYIIHGHIPRLMAEEVHNIGNSRFILHLLGKLRRFCLVHLRQGYVQRQLALRNGECRQCGLCCTVLFTCPMLTTKGLCRIYGVSRWKVCKVFPIDERDIEEVALMGGSCGYHYERMPDE